MAVFKFRNMNTGQATPIMEGEFAVGRADDAYVHLDDASVSRRHAMIINNSGVFFVEDLGSANGTAAHGAYINGRVRVNFDDVVHIGSVPFRIDPEVAGDVDAIPSAGLRTNNRAYMRRDTEKIPTVGESQRVAEVTAQTIPQENLSAPLVSTTHDMDAEDLNAITIKEPEPPKPAPMAAIRATSQGAFVPPAKPASTILRQSVPLRRASQKITLQHAPTPTPVPNPEPIRAPSQPLPRTEITPPKVATPQTTPVALATFPASVASTPAPVDSGVHWGWWLLMFLAGLGVGVMLGLYFAQVFFEMGGKPGNLPL